MRRENWAAMTVAMAILLALQFAVGIEFDSPMAALREAIQKDGLSFDAALGLGIASARL